MDLSTLVTAALAEDVGGGDVTTIATVPAAARAVATITQKQPGVIFGLDAVEEVFAQLDGNATVQRLAASRARPARCSPASAPR